MELMPLELGVKIVGSTRSSCEYQTVQYKSPGSNPSNSNHSTPDQYQEFGRRALSSVPTLPIPNGGSGTGAGVYSPVLTGAASSRLSGVPSLPPTGAAGVYHSSPTVPPTAIGQPPRGGGSFPPTVVSPASSSPTQSAAGAGGYTNPGHR